MAFYSSPSDNNYFPGGIMNSRRLRAVSASHSVRAAVRASLALGFGACAIHSAQAAEDSGTSTLDEVVVTAQFREQNLQTTPLSITAVTGEMLELRSQTNIAEVASQAPNVTL